MRSLKFSALLIPLLLIGCGAFTGTKRVFELATGPVQTTKASLLLHNAVGEMVAAMIEDPTVSGATKDRARQLYRATVCSQSESTVSTSDCDEGPSYRADKTVKAYEAVQNAQTEAELIAANDALVAQLVDLATIINGAYQ